MLCLFRYSRFLGLLLTWSVIQSYAGVENGWHTLPFGGAGVGDIGAWPRETYTTKEGIVFVHAPGPKYPPGANHLKGRGVVRLQLDRKTGRVVSAALRQSTGQPVLARAALDALKEWRTRPDVKVDSVDIPVVFAEPRRHWRYGG
ncbi:MAG TPA: TonB family protein [Candidatus Udaeobacter sp.]|nr:TonB family protein [Candidatus Udaeobacter sp.]